MRIHWKSCRFNNIRKICLSAFATDYVKDGITINNVRIRWLYHCNGSSFELIEFESFD